MPIHDQGYRRYGGSRTPPGHAWRIIARAGLLTLMRRRAFIGLLVLAYVPFFVRAVQLYLASTVPQASFLVPDAGTFRQYLEQQLVFVFFITVYAGAGLIANDRRAHALAIYLSKPLTRTEYVFGKFTILFTLVVAVTMVPALLLLIVQVAFSGSLRFAIDNAYLVPAIIAFTLIQAVAVSLAMLALSSLSRSSRYVGMLYAGLIFFSQALYGVVYGLTRDSRLAWVSIVLDLRQLGDAIFRIPLQLHLPVWGAAVMVVALCAGSLWVLRWRVRGVEVVQ